MFIGKKVGLKEADRWAAEINGDYSSSKLPYRLQSFQAISSDLCFKNSWCSDDEPAHHASLTSLIGPLSYPPYTACLNTPDVIVPFFKSPCLPSFLILSFLTLHCRKKFQTTLTYFAQIVDIHNLFLLAYFKGLLTYSDLQHSAKVFSSSSTPPPLQR